MTLQDTNAFDADNLFGGTQIQPVVADRVTLAAGQGVVKRGTVIIATDPELTAEFTKYADGDVPVQCAVLAQDTDATLVTDAPAYFTGEFNVNILAASTGVDIAAVGGTFRVFGIFPKNVVQSV